ncbi:hypothetical protein GGTG_03894 [Gaeumannomyces tritici R3-111a-1]|uniref:Uncharacterized protein n=1 Tax=Gaeumannomyces tritici (strain R3-111a-1) TaxID=644352 RepID=J3NRJ0_GAET3|nr:hypothetical protein GGTG_03894 [Gaeumannomyces tritici R3-111a-1]EJT78796.1 hypothetical protein GGTG_03894 [Gaeumannomyces tritici R3-111a-1]
MPPKKPLVWTTVAARLGVNAPPSKVHVLATGRQGEPKEYGKEEGRAGMHNAAGQRDVAGL